MFRELSPEDTLLFRRWAREHYHPGDPISELWHPVVQDECHQINAAIDIADAIEAQQEIAQWDTTSQPQP